MREDDIRKILIEYLEKNKIEFLQEINLGGCRIDFLIKNNGNWTGIEIKGDRANEFSTLGQLLNYYQHVSHLVLCASKTFVDKIKNTILNNPEINHIDKKLGWMVVDGGELKFNTPQNTKYYFLIKKNQKEPRYYSRFPKYDRLDDTDISIIELVKSKGIIMLYEIARLMNLSYENARKKIKNLEHFGYLKTVSKYPTSVSVGVKDEKGTSQ